MSVSDPVFTFSPEEIQVLRVEAFDSSRSSDSWRVLRTAEHLLVALTTAAQQREVALLTVPLVEHHWLEEFWTSAAADAPAERWVAYEPPRDIPRGVGLVTRRVRVSSWAASQRAARS